MGINYYLKKKNHLADAAARHGTGLHIGQSAYGWAFSLHVVPGIAENLEDWKDLWSSRPFVIVDEYGNKVSKEEMLSIVTERGTLSPEHEYSSHKRRSPEIPKDEWDKDTHLRRHIPEVRADERGCVEYKELNKINWGLGYDLLVGEWS
jgi:hypothetical protein